MQNFYRENSRERIISEYWLQSNENNKRDLKETVCEGGHWRRKIPMSAFILFAPSLTRLSEAPTLVWWQQD
jgi:hypothetical protein